MGFNLFFLHLKHVYTQYSVYIGLYSSQHFKWIKKVKPRTGIVQNSCLTLMKSFDPLQMLAAVCVYRLHNIILFTIIYILCA